MAFAVELVNVEKRFGSVTAVAGVDLAVGEGEFFSMLGPSGSGKTTCLRMIAGFESVTSGTIRLGGSDVSNLPPNKRDCNTVFQDYALFPHMSVIDNVSYGLKVTGVDKATRTKAAGDYLELVKLGSFAKRKPAELSGGQRQRVALARALVNQPKILLLDEPLGALDQKLREEMQTELKSIQREVGITFIFVTHDQGESLSMSDRIAVFNEGRVEQVGTPVDIYERPATEFVAGFVGTTNILGELAKQEFGLDGRRCMIRPERIRFVHGAEATTRPTVSGTVIDSSYQGSFMRTVVLLADGSEIIVQSDHPSVAGNTDPGVQPDVPVSSDNVSRGSTVTMTWDPANITYIADVGN